MTFILIFISTVISSIFGYLRYKYTYWEFQGVKQLKTHFLFGHIFKLRSVHFSELLHEVYQEFKGKTKIAGAYIFTKPIAVILDLDVIKAILIKDFNKFTDRKELRNEVEEPFSGNLFNLHGEKWRTLRNKLTPTFTSGKMKFMFPTIVGVAKEFDSAFNELVQRSGNGTVELHDIVARYTTDVIGTCVFGLECNSLKDPNVEFRRIGRRIFSTKIFSIRGRIFKLTYFNILKHFGAKRFDEDIRKFIVGVVRDTIATREREHIERKDFMNLLIELKNSKDPEKGLSGMSMEELAAQVFIFFAAGFETSSSNMSFGLFELAKNPQVQERVRKEILEILGRHNGELTYEAMMEMTYLDQVLTETMRKYPALSALTRVAMEEYEIPETNIKLEKDTKIYIPIKEIHYDPDIYENPYEFNPERFSAEEIKKRHPQAFLGFGDGPRNCIGLRFARMQVRVGLITLLKSFKFSMSEKTPNEIEICRSSSVLMPMAGVWIKAEKI